MSETSPDQRREKGERTRRRILWAAVELIGLKGLKAYTAQALAARAKVSKAVLFHHFTGLDEILPKTVDLFWELYEAFMGGPRPPDLRAYLKRLGRTSTDPKLLAHPAARASVELYRLSFFNPAVRKAMRSLLLEGRRRLRADLESYAHGAAERRRARVAADILMPLGDGLQLYQPLLGEDRAARRAWDAAASLTENYIRHGVPRRRKETQG